MSLWLEDVLERKKKDATYKGPGFASYARLVQSILAKEGIHVSLVRSREIQRSLCAVYETLLANGMDADFGCVVVHPYVRRVATNLTSIRDVGGCQKNQTITTTSKPSKRLRRRFDGKITEKDRHVLEGLYPGCGSGTV